jgi:hypothetical protein
MAAVVLALPAHAGVLTWEGDVGTGWNDGTVGSNTNWADGTSHRKPSSGDTLVFNTSGIYSGDLTLGGTVEVAGIMVGDGTDHLSPANFGANRVLGSGGTLRLGAGGLTVSMYNVALNPESGRNISFSTNIELMTGTFIRRLGTQGSGANSRRLMIDGVISGGSSTSPVSLLLDSSGVGSHNQAIVLTRSNTFVGDVTVKGPLELNKANGFGDPSNVVKLDTNSYLAMTESGNQTTQNAFQLVASTVMLGRPTSGKWTLAGNLTGTGSLLEVVSNGGQIVFAGKEQSFTHRVAFLPGSRAIIAAADDNGVVWPNSSGAIRFNSRTYLNTTAQLLVQGSFKLKQAIEVLNTSNTQTKVLLGEVNDGTNAFAALFEGNIDCQEPDFAALQLTADAGGRATFNGKISIAGGTFGFEKLGAGTVVVNSRLSQAVANTLPVGQVRVTQGTLLVNSPASDPFATTGILVSEGASLGGTGKILGNVTLTGTTAATLALGSDLGPLVVDGNVDFDNAGVLAVVFDASGSNRLDVNGLLDLSATNDRLVITAPSGLPGGVGLIASYDTLIGTFDNVDLSAFGPDYRIDYHYLGQNQIALVAPEPSSVLLLAAGLLVGLLCWKGQRLWSLWG